MCLTPRTVLVKRKHFDGHLGVGRFADPSALSPYLLVEAPCGHCADCLKLRQRSVEVRFIREAEAYPEVFFFTLTYDDDTLPLACVRWSVDTSTGEVDYHEPLPVVRFPYHKKYVDSGKTVAFEAKRKSSIFYDAKRKLLDIPKRENSNFYDWELPTSCETTKEYMRITPSLCRKDVRLFIKRFRVSYERKRKSLPEWRMCLIGEYGSNTARPHYHLATFGLPQDAAYFLADMWREQYGFVFLERALAVNKDGSNGFQKLGKYLGKYVTKDSFIVDSVRLGVAESSRLCMSTRFGMGKDLQSLRRYVLGFHLFGEYNPDTLIFKNSGKPVPSLFVRELSEHVSQHLSYEYCHERYPFPPSLKRYLFYSKNQYGEFYKTKIYNLALSVARNNIMALRQREFELFRPNKLDAASVARAVSSYENCKRLSSQIKNESFKKDSYQFYSKSIL